MLSMARFEAPRESIMNTHRAPWIVPLFGLLATACASAPVTTPPEAPRATPRAFAGPLTAAHQLVAFDSLDADPDEHCAVVRRGLAGEVRDARIAERWPDKNYGHVATGFAGSVHGAERDTLVSFSLPEIPADADITRARLTMYQSVGSGSGVSVHRVTQGWDESSVTWNSIAGAFDQAPVATLPPRTRCVGHVSVDVTPLVRVWQDGRGNHGIVLRQDDANTGFATSEATHPEQRPTLQICWRPTSVAWRK